MSDLVFELTEVTFAYQTATVLDGLTMHVSPGQRVVLLGANGSGKSTLLRLMDALAFPLRGTIKAFGRTLDDVGMQDDAVNIAFRRRVGLVFQNPDIQLFNPTVLDELAFGPLQLSWSRARIDQGIEEMFSLFSIGHLRDRSPHRLSSGEKKRVALASVLILDPEVLLLDEPTATLDPESQSVVVRFLTESRATARTVITTTHDLDIVEAIADYGVILDHGRIVRQGPVADLMRDADLLRRTHLDRSFPPTLPEEHLLAHPEKSGS